MNDAGRTIRVSQSVIHAIKLILFFKMAWIVIYHAVASIDLCLFGLDKSHESHVEYY